MNAKISSLVACREVIHCPMNWPMLRVGWRGFNKPRRNWRKKPSKGSNQQRNRASLVALAKTSKVRPAIRRSETKKRNAGVAQEGMLRDRRDNTTSWILILA